MTANCPENQPNLTLKSTRSHNSHKTKHVFNPANPFLDNNIETNTKTMNNYKACLFMHKHVPKETKKYIREIKDHLF